MLLKLVLASVSYATYRFLNHKKISIKNTFEKLIDNLNFYNSSNSTFTILDFQEKETYFKLKVDVPVGFSYIDLENNIDKFKSAFNCHVEIIDYKKFVDIYLYMKSLDNINYSPQICKPNELLLGYDYKQKIFIDMNTFPHVLIGGINGSGKTRFLYSIITNLISNGNVNIHYIQHLKSDLDIFKESKRVRNSSRNLIDTLILLKKINKILEHRVETFDKYLHMAVLNIKSYNSILNKNMPYHYLVIEEFSDLMPHDCDSKDVKALKKEILSYIERIIKSGRSLGIFLIICLQSSTCDQIPVFVRKQCNVRISFRQSESAASENLIGSDCAIKLKPKEYVMIADKKYIGKSFNIEPKYINKYISHTIQSDQISMFDIVK